MVETFILFADTDTTDERHATYVTLSNLTNAQSEAMRSEASASGVRDQMKDVRIRLSREELARRQRSNRTMIEAAKKELAELELLFRKNHVYALFDADGFLMHLFGNSYILTKIAEYSTKTAYSIPGVSMALRSVGLTSLALSMATGRTGAMRAAENTWIVLKKANNVTTPVREEGSVKGYLSVTFLSQDIDTVAALIERMACNISQKLDHATAGQITKEELYDRMERYGLTLREKEVAFLWLNHRTTAEIAAELFIAEGTVRNTIKKAYKKTGFHEKGRFIANLLLPRDGREPVADKL